MDPSPTTNLDELAAIKDLVHNQTTLTRELLSKITDPRRNLEAECGFPPGFVTSELYQALVDRDATAARANEVLARESWKVTPEVYEEEDGETPTEFEAAWDNLGRALADPTGTELELEPDAEEHGSSVWEYLIRADILSGIGRYGVIFLGLDDGLDPREPAKGIKEDGSRSRPGVGGSGYDGSGNPMPAPGEVFAGYGRYALTRNAAELKGRKLLYMVTLPETLAPVSQWEDNPLSPRYNRPLMYRLTLTDPANQSAVANQPTGTIDVHWTRVIHVADTWHTAGPSDVLAVPRLQPILNHVLSLQKPYHAGAEGYWRSCFAGLSFETNPAAGADVKLDVPRLKEAMTNFNMGLDRNLYGINGTFKTLSPSVVDPTPHIDAHTKAICLKIGVPVPVFQGYEIGEQASTNNAEDWASRLMQRQRSYLTPRLVRPFAVRLVMLGVLPSPQRIRVTWPDLIEQSPVEAADVATKRTQAMSAYVGGGVDALMAPHDFLTRELGYSDEEATTILDSATEHQEDKLETDIEKQHTMVDEGLMPDPAAPPEPKPGAEGEDETDAIPLTKAEG